MIGEVQGVSGVPRRLPLGWYYSSLMFAFILVKTSVSESQLLLPPLRELASSEIRDGKDGPRLGSMGVLGAEHTEY